MKTKGYVISTEKNMALVKIGHKEGCSGCGACKDKRDKTVNALNSIDAKVGDQVIVDISDQKYANSVFLLFVLPLLALIAGVLSGYYAADAIGLKSVDIIAVVCGIITASLVYVVIWLLRKKIDSKPTAYIISLDKER